MAPDYSRKEVEASGFLDGPAVVEGFTFLQRLYTDWKIAPAGVFDNNVTPDLFGSGRSAMYLGGTFQLDLFRTKYRDLDWGVAPHPYLRSGKPATPTGAWHIGANPRSRNKEAVAQFVRFMCSADVQVEWFKLRPYVPVRKDVWERLPEVFDTPTWRIIRYEVDNTAVPRPSTPGWREYEDLLCQTLPTLIAICTWRGVGYWMLFMLAGQGSIPAEVNEAAMLDGAGPWRRLLHVTLPLMKRTFGFVLVADTAANFLLFAPVYIITNGGPNGSTALLMFEAYRSAFALLDDGRSLAISSVILLIVAAVAVAELRLFRAEEGA